MHRRAPVPLVAAALLLGLWAVTARLGSVPGAGCEADYRELIAEIEANRAHSLASIEAQLKTLPADQGADLRRMREHFWDREESQRATAAQIHRDCLKALRADKG